MRPEDRRRFSAVASLVLGVFLGLTLIRWVPTGPLGQGVGGFLWTALGVGAIGLPTLGVGLALAGFDRLPRLDMKRAAILLGGLTLLVPFTIGVITDIHSEDFPGDVTEWGLKGRATGVVGGFAARSVIQVIGQPGGLLLAFLALTALTLATLAWHPLQRLEKRPAVEPESKGGLRPAATAEPEDDEEDDDGGVIAVVRAKVAKKRDRPRAEPAAAPPRAPTPHDDLLPPIGLLTSPPAQDTAADAAQLDRLGQALLDTLRTFKVEGTLAGRTSGPVVTQFEIVPAPGVKAGRLVALADDLAITMRAMSIRVAPIPGRGAVGVEVPNPTARMVTLRELLETPEWRVRSVLPIALGRDLEGKPVVTDLAKMPHLLIAGATGSGKSVAINTIITALVYRYTS
ncbi:MAG TPA: DNA translocase FtsK, partial [Gemmatimonadales bacterium]|nr:DNA translocase FtsK [Gemmatimonadales bacterium]